MTIRDGGRPRDERGVPYVAGSDPYDATTWPGRDAARGANGSAPRRRGGSGLGGLLRFLIFALVLAAVVLGAAVTILRPIVRGEIVGWAADNPAALGLPFVADLVREDLGPSLDHAPSDSPIEAPFTVNTGDTARTIADRLQEQGFLRDSRAFVFIAIERGVSTRFSAGDYILRRNMTPEELVALLEVAPASRYVNVGLREGLRIEQIAAKLETLPLKMDVKRFYDLVKHPPASLIAEHPWLAALKLPKGASLEGFLYPATYSILPETTPDELISMMLDKFQQQVGSRLKVPTSVGFNFYQVLTLASLVEREAKFDPDRAPIAGVFINRLNPKLFPTHLLGSDPTVFYVNDTLQLAKLDFAQWQTYSFWGPLNGTQLPKTLPPELVAYNTAIHKGLMPGPICTPQLASIDAVLHADTKDRYLYFLAKPDGTTVFARTFAEHQKNIATYGTPP